MGTSGEGGWSSAPTTGTGIIAQQGPQHLAAHRSPLLFPGFVILIVFISPSMLSPQTPGWLQKAPPGGQTVSLGCSLLLLWGSLWVTASMQTFYFSGVAFLG